VSDRMPDSVYVEVPSRLTSGDRVFWIDIRFVSSVLPWLFLFQSSTSFCTEKASRPPIIHTPNTFS
jgi:hypothetical protein